MSRLTCPEGWHPLEKCFTVPAAADAARIEADLNERRANLTQRLDRIDKTGDGPYHRDAAIEWLRWEHPDLLAEALDETGAPHE